MARPPASTVTVPCSTPVGTTFGKSAVTSRGVAGVATSKSLAARGRCMRRSRTAPPTIQERWPAPPRRRRTSSRAAGSFARARAAGTREREPGGVGERRDGAARDAERLLADGEEHLPDLVRVLACDRRVRQLERRHDRLAIEQRMVPAEAEREETGQPSRRERRDLLLVLHRLSLPRGALPAARALYHTRPAPAAAETGAQSTDVGVDVGVEPARTGRWSAPCT